MQYLLIFFERPSIAKYSAIFITKSVLRGGYKDAIIILNIRSSIGHLNNALGRSKGKSQ